MLGVLLSYISYNLALRLVIYSVILLAMENIKTN